MNSVQGEGSSRFADNFNRLMGMHGLSQHAAAQLLGVSPATMSAWMNGKTQPSLNKAIAIGTLFDVPTDRLMGAEFADLLEKELSSRDRFVRVDERIRRGQSRLRSV
jgi:transcriptional regulator with XRE-family HTH domain